jgi:hypothetical protein
MVTGDQIAIALETNRFLFREQARTHRHRHGQHCGHGHRMDQNGPRVRVRKMVRWPATESFRYMRV